MTDDVQKPDEKVIDPELAEDVKKALSAVEDEGEEGAPSEIRDLLRTPEAMQTIQEMVVTAVTVIEERHSGPLPSPRHLKEYEEIVPGGAERIFKMAEREQQHRHNRQDEDADFRDTAFAHVKARENRGQAIACVLCFSILGIGVYLISLGHPRLATTMIITTLVGIASTFLLRKTRKPKSPPTDTA